MVKSMNTKLMAALAVFAMVFAGFGAMAIADDNDAATAGEGDLILAIDGYYLSDEDLVAVVEGIGAIAYVTTLDEDYEEKITILNKEYFDAMKGAGLIKGMTVTFTATDLENEDIVQGLDIFTAVEMNKLGEIVDGVDTKVTIDNDVLAKDVTVELVLEEDAEAAIAVAVAIAVAEAVEEVEAEYADYLSPEEVAIVVEDAKLSVIESYKGYKSPEEVKKIVADAVDEAIAEYIATHPAKDDKTFFYAFIVALAALVGVVGVFGYKDYVKPKIEAKKAAEPPQTI